MQLPLPFNLQSLQLFDMLDELCQMAGGGDLMLAYRQTSEMIEALEMESTLKSPTSIPVRKGGQFLPRALGSSAKCHTRRWDKSRPAYKISDEPRYEKAENSKQYWRKNFPGPWHGKWLSRQHPMKFKGNHEQLWHGLFCLIPDWCTQFVFKWLLCFWQLQTFVINRSATTRIFLNHFRKH